MTDYEKLKELLDNTFAEQYEKRGLLTAHHTAQDLLSNGVIVPPCKVGDTAFVKWRLHRNSGYGIYPVKVYALRWDEKKNNFRVCVNGDFEISAYGGKYTHHYQAAFAWDNFGKTVFLTKSQAEKALAEREKK